MTHRGFPLFSKRALASAQVAGPNRPQPGKQRFRRNKIKQMNTLSEGDPASQPCASELKKSEPKWTRAVQTRAVPGSTVSTEKGLAYTVTLRRPKFCSRKAGTQGSRSTCQQAQPPGEPVFSSVRKAGKERSASSRSPAGGACSSLGEGRLRGLAAGLHLIGRGPPSSGRAICFTQSTGSNISLIQKRRRRHPPPSAP